MKGQTPREARYRCAPGARATLARPPPAGHTPRPVGPREEILQAVRRFAAAEAAPFVPGQTYIPASGKQIGPDEIAACVDAALDGWLIAGRFSEQLERDLAHRVGTRWARRVKSGAHTGTPHGVGAPGS